MSVLRVFLTADSEFVIENLLNLKGKPEIDAREKSTLFSWFFYIFDLDTKKLAIQFYNQNVRHQKLHNICGACKFWKLLASLKYQKTRKKHVIVSFDRDTKEPGFFNGQIRTPLRKIL